MDVFFAVPNLDQVTPGMKDVRFICFWENRVGGRPAGIAWVRSTTAVLPCCIGPARPLFQDRDMDLTWVELGGPELPTPCLQSDVSTRVGGSDVGNQLPLSDRHVPLRTVVNGTC